MGTPLFHANVDVKGLWGVCHSWQCLSCPHGKRKWWGAEGDIQSSSKAGTISTCSQGQLSIWWRWHREASVAHSISLGAGWLRRSYPLLTSSLWSCTETQDTLHQQGSVVCIELCGQRPFLQYRVVKYCSIYCSCCSYLCSYIRCFFCVLNV